MRWNKENNTYMNNEIYEHTYMNNTYKNNEYICAFDFLKNF